MGRFRSFFACNDSFSIDSILSHNTHFTFIFAPQEILIFTCLYYYIICDASYRISFIALKVEEGHTMMSEEGVIEMANQVEPKLIKPLYDELQQERFVTLATVDHESGGPNVSAISWVLAKDEETIYFAIDNRSRIIQNIANNKMAVINVIANESTYSISGEAMIKEEKLEGVPLKLALIKLVIKEVRDVMFYGSKITTAPQYDKTYDKDAAARLDMQVMNVMKKA